MVPNDCFSLPPIEVAVSEEDKNENLDKRTAGTVEGIGTRQNRVYVIICFLQAKALPPVPQLSSTIGSPNHGSQIFIPVGRLTTLSLEKSMQPKRGEIEKLTLEITKPINGTTMNSEYRKALLVLRTSRQDLLLSRKPKITRVLKEVSIKQHKDQMRRKSTMEKIAYVDER